MATVLHSPHRIRSDEPNGYREREQIWLQLQYRLEGNTPKFSYRGAIGSPEEDDPALVVKVEQQNWSSFMTREEFVANLDIAIDADSRVTVETISAGGGNVLLWSLGTDAVMTREPRTDFYGELRYWNGGQFVPREDFDEAACSRIRFKAKKKARPPANHKFSYNVIYRRQGNMVEFEIDPDIKNPSS